MASIIRADAIQNLNTSNLITQTNTTTITVGVSGQTVTIPSGVTFNTASASINLPAGSVGISQLSATGTPTSSNFLRGDNSWQTISTTPSQLVSSIPLATGASYTAAQLASIGTNNEVVALPTLNTFGTTRTNSVAAAYTSVGDNGNTALRNATTSQTSRNRTLTYTGISISNSANPTNGGTTITDTVSVPEDTSNYFTSTIINLTDTKYLCFNGALYDANCSRGNRMNVFVASVDSSTGNVTKGSVITFNNSFGGGGNPLTALEFARITSDIVYFRFGTGTVDYTGVITISGTTCTFTSDADAAGFSGANGSNTILTSNNILGYGTGASWKTASWTSSPVGIGTVTTTTQVGDYLSGGSWTKMADIGTNAAEYVLTTYTNTSGVATYITYSVNQTTGALTQVETGAQTLINSNAASSMVFKDKNSFVGSNASFAFTNGARNTLTYNGPYTLGTMRYNSGNLFYSFGTSLTGFPTNQGFTVNAYGTSLFNYVGVVKSTDSTSPIDIVTDGVATGFAGLTSGTLYYATSPIDGTVTTSSASGLLIGKAISTTEILLQRSNTQ